MNQLIAIPGGWELVLVVLVILLLVGAKRLPELARGTGQALRIFKAETKGLIDDDPNHKLVPTEGKEVQSGGAGTPPVDEPVRRDQRGETTS